MTDAPTTHSPGPWLFEEGSDRSILDAHGQSLMCDLTYYPWCPEKDADWRLIAAAPELFEMLKALQRWHQEEYQSNAVLDAKADALIARVEGR